MTQPHCNLIVNSIPLQKNLQQILPDLALKSNFTVCNFTGFLQSQETPNQIHLFFLTEKTELEEKQIIGQILNRIKLSKFHLFILLGDPDEDFLSQLDESRIFATLPASYKLSHLKITLRNAREFLLNQIKMEQLSQRLNTQTNELQKLNDIGIALSAERNMQSLLNLILQKAREITRSDAGTLYLVEKKEGVDFNPDNHFEDKQLRFKLSHCDSKNINFSEFTMPIAKKSVAGYVTLTNEGLNIPDIYLIPPESGIGHDRSFDESIGYRTKSLLVIPMKTHKDEIIGVLQLINRKKQWETILETPAVVETDVINYDFHCEDLANSLASQAAVAIENNRLYDEIKSLFDGFVLASVHAIEQRDPTTSGHSERVAQYTLALAETVSRIQTGPYRLQKFTENQMQQMRYAGLLHDFGKIGVREDILVKAKKLFPYELELIIRRFKSIKSRVQLEYSGQKIKHLLTHSKLEALDIFKELDILLGSNIQELDEFLKLVFQANEPTVLDEQNAEQLISISKRTFQENGAVENYLSPQEMQCLSIARGSLSEQERIEIESHVTHTYNFLKRIPWTTELKAVPEIAHGHHEKLDGSGYPQQLKGDQIPVQARMMTIVDIYDALTAWDRPYKKAVPVEKALDILGYEQKAGKIDTELLRIFIDAKIYETVERPSAL